MIYVISRYVVFGVCLFVGVGAVWVADVVVDSFPAGEVALIRPEIEEYDRDAGVVQDVLWPRIDFNINGIRVGSTERNVLKALGHPSNNELNTENRDYPTKILRYNGYLITLANWEGEWSVDLLSVDAPTVWESEGIRVGTTAVDVIGRLGPGRNDNSAYLEYPGVLDGSYIILYVQDGVVTSIDSGYYGC